MTQAKHTPAPWEVRQAPAVNSSDYDIYQAGVPASGGKIARVPGREGRAQTTVANARLIAAAPELFKACERALQIVEDDRTSFVECVTYSKGIDKDAQHIVDGYDAVIGIMQSAIAKVKGDEA